MQHRSQANGVQEASCEDSNENTEELKGDEELTEEQIEDFIRKEQLTASEGNNADTKSKYTPQINMEFRNRDDAHHFFLLCFHCWF
jgi:hypothetical protein